MKKFLTIIVPVYKIKEDFLRECIESLLNQGRTDYQVILVDDGSPDDCGKICDEYADSNSIIKVIHQQNQGVSEARNNAVRCTSTEWLCFVDADDWVEADYVSGIYESVSNRAADADIIMFDYVREYRSGKSAETLGVQEGFLTSEDLEICRKAAFYKLIQNGKFNPYTVIGLWDKVYRTDFLKENSIWFIPEARKGQDRLFNADALNTTDKLYYMPETFYHYRCWEESRTNRYDADVPKLTKIELDSLGSLIKKHNLENKVEEYFKCRICTRLYACMRLYYFHSENTASYREQIENVRELVKSEPFNSALKTVKMGLLTSQEKIFVLCLKYKLYGVCRMLVQLRSKYFAKKLS